ncbi:hypothetical protein H5410_042578 [Solanum commersonii]|uniref:Uncharacterized protein n=1 Tax=Solanum commersonii TaxID=4109 RepID=A0A9J5XXW3_SOLCO|nr:hypothetical protein H5410_042578 [Solanum commersonii]
MIFLNINFFPLMKPFQHVRYLNRFNRKLGMSKRYANNNGKIWLFVNHGFEINNLATNFIMVITIVYAKCDPNKRLKLWEDITQLASGGLLVLGAEVEDFQNCIESNDIYQVQFKHCPFTWRNSRAESDCIFEKLDRILVNNVLLSKLNIIKPYAPLLLLCENREIRFIKPFRFLNFWTDHKGLKEVVSNDTCGNSFQQLMIREKISRMKEKHFSEFLSLKNRAIMQRAKVEYSRYLHLEKKFWQQKGGRRQRMRVSRVQNSQGQLLKNEEEIANKVVNHIQKLITEVENFELGVVTDEEEEVKNTVYKLNGDSFSGPGGLTCNFYQVCWDIIGKYIYRMVQTFYAGSTSPKSTHTNLIMIPKKDKIQSFSNIRHISLKKQLGQKINKEKNSYYLHQNVVVATASQMEKIIGW